MEAIVRQSEAIGRVQESRVRGEADRCVSRERAVVCLTYIFQGQALSMPQRRPSPPGLASLANAAYRTRL